MNIHHIDVKFFLLSTAKINFPVLGNKSYHIDLIFGESYFDCCFHKEMKLNTLKWDCLLRRSILVDKMYTQKEIYTPRKLEYLMSKKTLIKCKYTANLLQNFKYILNQIL